jgi:hypothetical protein
MVFFGRFLRKMAGCAEYGKRKKQERLFHGLKTLPGITAQTPTVFSLRRFRIPEVA